MNKKYSPMIQKLVDYGNACIINLQNNDKTAAKAMLASMVAAVNQYHIASLYAVQYDIYNYMNNMAKKDKFTSKFNQNTDDNLNLILSRPSNIKMPADSVLNSISTTESYINTLIKHAKDFEKDLCNKRNQYLTHNGEQLINIAKTHSYDACGSDNLKDIVKSMIQIT